MSARDLPTLQRDVIAATVRQARANKRTMELLGRGVVEHAMSPDEARDVHEAAMERAAIAAGDPGFISTPTTLTRSVGDEPSGLVFADRCRLSDVGAFRLDPIAKRLADLRKIIGWSGYSHLAAPNVGGDDVIMVTLTYERTDQWEPSHIRECLQRMRMHFKRREWRFRYVWVAELQLRGAVHYHVMVFVPLGESLPFADDQGWWPHGMSNTKRVNSPLGYLMHYLKKGKGHQKDYTKLPKGARSYGVGGLEEDFKLARRWLRAPTFVRRLSSIRDAWKRAKGGGWLSPTGQKFASEFERVWVGCGYALRRVCRHDMTTAMPEGVGPFCWLRMRTGAAA